MGCGYAAQFSRLNLKASARLVFFHLRDQGACNDDGRAACAPRTLAEDLGYSEKVVRNALRELEANGFIHSETSSRRYTMVSFPQASNRRRGAEKGAEKGAENWLIFQCDSQNEGAEKGAEKGATGVTAVNRSSAVDVSPALSVSVRATTARATPPVDKSPSKAPAPPRRRRQEDYDDAIARAPRLGNVCMQIDRIYAELAGSKYPWSQHPYAATILADLLCSHGEALVTAAAERYFQRGDAWIERKGWAIDEFGRLFAGLIVSDSVQRRTGQIGRELETGTRPSTPKELRAQLDAMRRRQLDAMTATPEPEPRKELSVA